MKKCLIFIESIKKIHSAILSLMSISFKRVDWASIFFYWDEMKNKAHLPVKSVLSNKIKYRSSVSSKEAFSLPSQNVPYQLVQKHLTCYCCKSSIYHIFFIARLFSPINYREFYESVKINSKNSVWSTISLEVGICIRPIYARRSHEANIIWRICRRGIS